MILSASLAFAAVCVLAVAGGLYLALGRGVGARTVGPLVFGVIGVAALGLGAAVAWNSYRFARRSVPVTGEVARVDVSMQPEEGGRLVPVYTPSFRYVTAQGEPAEFAGPNSYGRDYEQGEQVAVRYVPGEPGSARLDAFDWRWLVAAGAFAFGATVSGIAVRARRPRRAPPPCARRQRSTSTPAAPAA